MDGAAGSRLPICVRAEYTNFDRLRSILKNELYKRTQPQVTTTPQHENLRGFGLGFERLVVYVTGMGNVRDVIPFPRTQVTLLNIKLTQQLHNQNSCWPFCIHHFQ